MQVNYHYYGNNLFAHIVDLRFTYNLSMIMKTLFLDSYCLPKKLRYHLTMGFTILKINQVVTIA